MPAAPEQQEDVARALVAAAGQVPWVRLEARVALLGGWAALDATWRDRSGEDTRVGEAGFDEWEELKQEMADEHGAWFSAAVSIERDGTYAFSFNYDQEDVDVEVAEGISDSVWVDDLEEFPRPWARVPPWHPVRKRFTEQTWRRRWP